ncbi:hypothetical protein ONZ43_g1242 [Nemania bipapillata]|uniref:Uncharacterized protein n=1 Tax=Nemania bipapillata TaxID=110536 RepID=A0ACC2J580_9PEZI|nr:hypothetical protein ONZ43_g1242 [Nemania bipapillata]
MSTQPPEREDADMGQDYPDLTPDGDAVSSDDETIKGDLDQGHLSEAVEEELREEEDLQLHEDASNPPSARGSVAASRYRQLLRDQADVSDEGSSMDDLPRRAGSPINSLLSAPDDSPSIQVRAAGLIIL